MVAGGRPREHDCHKDGENSGGCSGRRALYTTPASGLGARARSPQSTFTPASQINQRALDWLLVISKLVERMVRCYACLWRCICTVPNHSTFYLCIMVNQEWCILFIEWNTTIMPLYWIGAQQTISETTTDI